MKDREREREQRAKSGEAKRKGCGGDVGSREVREVRFKP